MRHFSKIPSTVFAIALILVFLTGCKPEQVVKVVETVREVPVEVIKEVPKEVTVIKEVPVEVIKEVEVPGEPVIKEVIKEVPVPIEPEEENLQEELIKIFNDNLISIENRRISSFKHSQTMDAKASMISKLIKNAEISFSDWKSDTFYATAKSVLINENSSNSYVLTYFKNTVYSSSYYKNIKKKAMIFQELEDHVVTIHYEETSGTIPKQNCTVSVGFADVVNGINNYTLVLFEIPSIPDPDI